MATEKNRSTLTEAGKKVGKALARSGHTMEETGHKMKKAAEKIVKKATKQAEKTVESALGTIKKEVSELTHKKPAGAAPEKSSLFKPGKGMTVEAQIGFLAGDIFKYLTENGPTPVTKITLAMKNRGSIALLGAALGWLAREGHVVLKGEGADYTISFLRRS